MLHRTIKENASKERGVEYAGSMRWVVKESVVKDLGIQVILLIYEY